MRQDNIPTGPASSAAVAAFLDKDAVRLAMEQVGAGDYTSLELVLRRALAHAAFEKGADRHAAKGVPFERQRIMQLIDLYGTGFALGQAAKKAAESQRLPRDRAVAELLGAINYLAGVVLYIESDDPHPPVANDNWPVASAAVMPK